MNLEILKSVNTLLPMKVWRAEKGFGSFLTFDLDASNIIEKNTSSDDMHLWVYLCFWEINFKSEVILNSELIDDENAHNLDIFVGRSFFSMSINDENIINFEFEGDLILSLYFDIDNEADDDLFLLYIKNHGIVSCSPAFGLVFEEG